MNARRTLRAGVVLGVLCLAQLSWPNQAALAQSAPPEPDAVVRSLIPDVISLRRPPESAVTFDLSVLNYPPAKFPARYLSNTQEFAVFSSSARPWTVQLEVVPHPDVHGNLLEVGKLSYRLGGGEWLPVLPTSQVLISGVAPTLGWTPLTLEFALDLTGAEVGSDSGFDLRFTASLLP